MNTGSFTGIACLALLLGAPAARADTVSLAPSKDNTLVQSANGSLSNGAGANFFAGKVRNGGLRRGLVAFDILAAIDSGAATVDSVRLSLHMSLTRNGAQPVELHRVVANWGEGTSVSPGGGGKGAASAAGDATWIHTFFNTGSWATPGGDFDPAVSASKSVNGIASYTWRAAALNADVQSWIDHPSTNFGWLVLAPETAGSSAKRFDSRTNATVSSRPVLDVFFTLVATGVHELPPGAAALRLEPSYPNPFNPQTTLAYWVPMDARVRLAVVDARGQVVARLVDGVQTSGRHVVAWNGRDSRGAPVASGVYRLLLRAGGEERSRSVTLLK